MAPLDRILERFLRQLGVLDEDALLHFNLAPLSLRRDMAALGVIHRTVLGLGPQHFKQWFYFDTMERRHSTRLGRRHGRQLADPYWQYGREYLNRSLVGYVSVYNLLPERIVSATKVKDFQTLLQDMVKDVAASGDTSWRTLYSTRHARTSNAMRWLADWKPQT